MGDATVSLVTALPEEDEPALASMLGHALLIGAFAV
jgi:hypothetical protein